MTQNPHMIRISAHSNLLYLPLVYFLPQDIMVKCPTLCSLPRKVREVMYRKDMMEVVNSNQFLLEIMDAVAYMAFPHFGFSGWKENYTGYFPVWKLSYMLPHWCKALEKEIGWNLQALMNIHSSKSIPFFDSNYINTVMERVVKRVIKEEGWQPMLDVIRKTPCDEDFEKYDTNVRKDFLRKWYHTRSKRVQTVSLEACMEDTGSHIHDIVADSGDIAENVAAEDFCQRFKARLSKRDIEILELRMEGFTYEEIAEKLGYKNHSGVIKRIWAIQKEFLRYEKTRS